MERARYENRPSPSGLKTRPAVTQPCETTGVETPRAIRNRGVGQFLFALLFVIWLLLWSEGIDGAWVGHWTVIYNKNHGSGHGTWRGTGALQGKMLYLDVYDGEDDGQLEAMCAGIGMPEGYVRTVGYILEVPEP